jgi:hypothetical protein
MKTTIISAIYDSYDTVKPIQEQDGLDVKWVMVTDSPALCDDAMKWGWFPVYEPRHHLHPNRAAKTPKCLPWLYTDTDSSIWIDGSFRVISPTFAKDVLALADPIAQFVHPWRDCALAEAEECIAIPKYAKEVLQEQLEAYEERLPRHWGLWATGVIARYHSPEVVQMGFDWLADIYRWSYQDQVSYPRACRRNGLRPTSLPGMHLANQWLSYEGSSRHSHG